MALLEIAWAGERLFQQTFKLCNVQQAVIAKDPGLKKTFNFL